MMVKLVYPSTKEGLKTFQERKITLHAKAILDYIDNLDYSYKEKQKLITQIQNRYTSK